MDKSAKFYDEVLIKLIRKYGKDELVASLLKQLSEKDVELGQLKAEIEHLNHELTVDKVSKAINKAAKIEARKQELHTLLINENNRLKKEVKLVRQDNRDLIAKMCTLTKDKP